PPAGIRWQLRPTGLPTACTASRSTGFRRSSIPSSRFVAHARVFLLPGNISYTNFVLPTSGANSPPLSWLGSGPRALAIRSGWVDFLAWFRIGRFLGNTLGPTVGFQFCRIPFACGGFRRHPRPREFYPGLNHADFFKKLF